MGNAWIGIDTGGTFTDLTLANVASGSYWFHKTPTTPDDASRGILQGMRELLEIAEIDPGEIGFVCHGTTLATNAILEGKWARTGMITTAGFRDVIELARQRRPNFFNLDVPKPTPPASRDLREEVTERVAHDGSVIVPLDEEAVREAAARLKARGCTAVAICFLHSYANQAHEARAAEIVREVWPDVYLCTSSGVLAEFREYERFATTSVNASLLPVIDTYLERFERGVNDLGVEREPLIMQSNGGAVSPAAVRAMPVNTFFSGPAGGVIGAAGLGTEAGFPNVVTLDMGGTSTDVALIRDGIPGKKGARDMAGFPVRTRTLDLHTIGAGGGSLAWIDPGGLLKVGPKSAGAMPGPASYGRGGELPTVTDANMVLGRLNQSALLDGRMQVFPEKGLKAIETRLCGPLGLDAVRAAAGVVEIINVNMMGAVRVISVEQGEDPRRFALMPFGGAGPLHACDIARIIGIPHIFVPQRPGILSALGLLHADTRGDFSLTRLATAEASSLAVLQDGIAQLGEKAKAWLRTERLPAQDAVYEWAADMRYVGQNFELAAALPSDRLDEATIDGLVEQFHTAHEQAYGYRMGDRPVEIVNIRLGVGVVRPVPPPDQAKAARGTLDEALIEVRPVWYPDTDFTDTPIYRRTSLPLETSFEGPAVVEQMDATTVIPPDARVLIDRFGNLMIHISIEANPEGQS
ncbi:hydantoinase/oxoprolinase family protein [Lutibaculum baratangense]|uniref:N-methylhydantoinase A n=1 Tax=Lutibaculum baratangense AMV1 TaxID=631454 RepID=V4RKM3_9HYPH|nr:hydantoinase/oxoprolinase family protein [Lutibaculum baratangense]ESR23810.1 N-methylhydantoinase A [Lutibaculum baratangense AMV1]